MTQAPAFSVVVPVRNAPRELRQCLSALRASDFTDYELIVVDDASTDDSAAVASSFGARLVRLERQSGPAAARNAGAQDAAGGFLVFVDSDVCVHRDTLTRMAAAFASERQPAALFGSYDLMPAAPHFFSQYKNLFHHFVHQEGSTEASTFWAGCGAIRRSVFLSMGGFDTRYARPCIEDIELGGRLRRAGHRIALAKDVQAMHLKRWTLLGLLRSDIWDRGVPWTELILRERHAPSDLNLKAGQPLCALLAASAAALLLLAVASRPVVAALLVAWALLFLALEAWSGRHGASRPALALAALAQAAILAALLWLFPLGFALGASLVLALVLINRRFYAFFARARHPLFAFLVLPLHVLYYLYSGLAFGLGLVRHLWFARARTAAPGVETR